jgi:hypothetical protein
MKANNTSETNIKVVGNIFRLTFVFNDLKPSLNLYMSSPIVLNLFLIFEIRGVISVNTCLEGGNLVNLTIHAPWYIMGCPPTSFIKPHAKYKHGGGAAKALFCRNIMDACEAREHGGDSKRKHQVEGTIMQAKEWMGTLEGARGHEATSALEKNRAKRRREVSLPSSSLFVCSSL